METRRRAYCLTRVYPEGGARSFFGGWPMAPEGFRWPVKDGRAMPFLAQIDTADLPRPLLVSVPEGILYFFLDPYLADGYADGGSIVFVPGRPSLVRQQSPAPLPLIGEHDEAALYGGWTFRWRSAAWHPFARPNSPKYEIAFAPFEDESGPSWGEPGYDSRASDEMHERVKANRKAALARRLGAAMFALREREEKSDYFREPMLLFDPQQELRDSDRLHGKAYGPMRPLYEDWPRTWAFVGCHLAALREPNAFLLRALTGDLRKQFLAEVEKWCAKAIAAGATTRLTPEERKAYRSWVSGRYLKHRKAWSELFEGVGWKPGFLLRLFGRPDPDPQRIEAERSAHQAIWSGLLDPMLHSVLDATSICLDAEVKDRTLVSPAMLDDYACELQSYGFHQMFGFGKSIQNAADENRDKLLLLQLTTDYGMFWMFGDCGAIQIWIDREDLAAGRFERATITLEGG
jgi:hypothetical protein